MAPSLLSPSISSFLLLLQLFTRGAVSTRSCLEQHNKCRYDMSCDIVLSLAEALCDLRPDDQCPRLCALALVALLDTRGAWGRGENFRRCRCRRHPHCKRISHAMKVCSGTVQEVEAAVAAVPKAPVDCALAILLCHSSAKCRLILKKTMESCGPQTEPSPNGCGGPLRSSTCTRHLRLLQSTPHGHRPVTCYCSGRQACGARLYGVQEGFALPMLAVNSLSWKPLRSTHNAGIAMQHLQVVISDAKCPALRQALQKDPPRRQCPSLTGRTKKQLPNSTTMPPLCYFLGSGAARVDTGVGARLLLATILPVIMCQ